MAQNAQAQVQAQWRRLGEGLRLDVARNVAKTHGVPLEAVLKGWYVEALDGPGGFAGLDGVEDHVIMERNGADVVKFSNNNMFRTACQNRTAAGVRDKITVVVMPYADLHSCVKIDEISRATPPQLGYRNIEVANRDLLVWKKRDMAALDDEAYKCLLLQGYIVELGQKFGVNALDPFPERSDIIKLEAQHKFKNDLDDARREVLSLVETITEELDRVAMDLKDVRFQPSLLGCGI